MERAHTDSDQGDGDASTEPSILEFARHHGLSVEFTTEEPFELARQGSERVNLTEIGNEVSHLHVDHVLKSLASERLIITEEVKELLKSTMTCPPKGEFQSITQSPYRRSSYLRLELPLLCSDNDYDVLHFGTKTNEDLESLSRLMAPITVENTLSISWPVHSTDVPAQVQAELRKEKLEIPNETSVYLRAVLKEAALAPGEAVPDFELEPRKVSLRVCCIYRLLTLLSA